MKTLEEIKTAVIEKTTWNRETNELLDNRDVHRLLIFYPTSEWEPLGYGLTEGAEAPEIEVFTRENIINHLKSDLEFAFEKAHDERGISSSLMHEVVHMWVWILDDHPDLIEDIEYAPYGLPFYRKVALQYGITIPGMVE